MSTLARNKLDAQSPAGRATNDLQSYPFTEHPPAVNEVQNRANTIQLDYGGLYGNDLDDWLRAEREQTEAHYLHTSARDKNP